MTGPVHSFMISKWISPNQKTLHENTQKWSGVCLQRLLHGTDPCHLTMDRRIAGNKQQVRRKIYNNLDERG